MEPSKCYLFHILLYLWKDIVLRMSYMIFIVCPFRFCNNMGYGRVHVSTKKGNLLPFHSYDASFNVGQKAEEVRAWKNAYIWNANTITKPGLDICNSNNKHCA